MTGSGYRVLQGGGWLGLRKVLKTKLYDGTPPNPSHTSRTGKCSKRESDLESGVPGSPPASPPPQYIPNHGLTCMHIARIASQSRCNYELRF